MKQLPKATYFSVYASGEITCPHCGADIWEAKTTLGRVAIGWPHSGFAHTRDDGYANAGDYLEVDCTECAKPAAVLFDEKGSMTLIAARTDADERLVGNA